MVWTICEEEYQKNNIVNNGNKFLAGNVYMGFRGTMEEFTKNELVACNLANIYDKVGDNWAEPINAPNGFYATLRINDTEINLLEQERIKHLQCLDIKNGVHKRKTEWETDYGRVSISAERFVSLADIHLMCLKYSVSIDNRCKIEIKTGIDGDIWDINGPHLENYLIKGDSELLSAAKQGYVEMYNFHKDSWSKRWEMSDVIIEGCEEDQLAIRYSIYQLQIIAPFHSNEQSIAARGLSGQTYKGAIFWDTEMFMLPFFLHTAPEIAVGLINYRIKTLKGAREKAAYYGYRGAFYAWESHEGGEDACSDFNVTDVFTGRPVKTYFRDKQIHISADVAYAIWEVYNFTGDIKILINGGAEVILECARFFYSYAYYKEDKDRYEILDVIGPDEYHERVNNNAYTNKMIYHTLDVTLKILELLSTQYPSFYTELIEKLDYSGEISNIIRFKEKLYVIKPNEKNLIIEQFDGYHKLEDCSLSMVKSRVLDTKEYWGGGHGVASNTKIIKQADVAFMLYLFKDEYSNEEKKQIGSITNQGQSMDPA